MEKYSKVYIRGNNESKTVTITSDLKPAILDTLIFKWQSLLDTAAKIVNVPAGLIMKLNEDTIEVFMKSNTLGNPYEVGEKADLIYGLYCETVIGTQKKLLVPDAKQNPVWSLNNPDIDLNMVSYLGFPVNWPDGEVFGTVCLLDSKENHYNNDFSDLVNHLKQHIETDLELLYKNNYLEEKNLQLEQLNNTKTKFLSLISHDVRGKVGLLDVFLKLIIDNLDTYDKPELKKYLISLRNNANTTYHTLEGLLTWSKNDLIHINPDLKQIDLIGIIQNLIDFFQDSVSIKQIEIKTEFYAEKAIISADENMITTSLRNILSNAIKSSNNESTISIRVSISDNQHVVEIEDKGIGMSRDLLDSLFDYTKIEDMENKYSGKGARIGLILTKEFLDKNNAVIKVESEINKGTIFTITFQT